MNHQNSQNILGIRRLAILSLILFCLSWRLALPIELTDTDLGRHIKNGELLLHGAWDVLYKNYYSYTFPGYPFINHHWFFGVLCFLIWHFFGFTGISLFFIIVRLAAFLIFFKLAERFSSFSIACAFSLLSLPIVASRTEIRPEIISTLFGGLFWWMLDSYKQGGLKPGRLKGWLIVLQIIWVNTHIFFILGPILISFSWLQAKLDNDKQGGKDLRSLFWLVLGACLVNPSGLNGALLPLSLFQGFHTTLSENLPMFVSAGSFPHYQWRCFILNLELLLISWTFMLQYKEIKQNMMGLSLVIILSLSVLFANRLILLFSLFWIPLVSYACGGWMQVWSSALRKIITIILIAVGVWIALTAGFDLHRKPVFGLSPGVSGPAQFFKEKGLSGTIFNNYDIGGYLIFNLSPSYKLFVDNRAEAFPKDFFDKILYPAEEDNRSWYQLDSQYHFNVIIIYLSWINDYDEHFIFNRIIGPKLGPGFYR